MMTSVAIDCKVCIGFSYKFTLDMWNTNVLDQRILWIHILECTNIYFHIQFQNEGQVFHYPGFHFIHITDWMNVEYWLRLFRETNWSHWNWIATCFFPIARLIECRSVCSFVCMIANAGHHLKFRFKHTYYARYPKYIFNNYQSCSYTSAKI